jgi:hypothetical protein
MIIQNILRTSIQTVDIQNEDGKNEFGEAKYSSANVHVARFTYRANEIKNPGRESLDYDAKCYLYPNVAVEVGSLVHYNGESYKAVFKYMPADIRGALAHIKLYLKRYDKS